MIKIITPLLVTVLLVVSCGDKNPSQQEQDSVNNEFALTVSTAKATLRNVSKELLLSGKVVSDPDKTVSYSSLVGGVIDRVYFMLGDKVSSGQTLLDIRSTELSILQSEQVALESDLAVATRELTAAQSMFDDNMLSERELLEAKGKVRQAEAALSRTHSDMSVFGVNRGGGMFSINAPTSGYIIKKNASKGSTMSAYSEPLFTIADLSTVWVEANVYAGNLQSVREGMEVDITSISYPNESFSGKIEAVSQVFDPEDKALKARVILHNKEMKLKPEMSVLVRVKNRSTEQLVCVPTDAVIFDNDSYFVVVRKDKDFEVKEIFPASTDNQVTYISSGLNEGEEVVVKNQLLIFSDYIGK